MEIKKGGNMNESDRFERNRGRINKYSKMMPTELKMLINDAPNGDTEWSIVMYLCRYSGRGNIITLGKISNFFGIDKTIMFEKLNKMSSLWVVQYLNSEGYDKTYYTYEITDIAVDLMIKLVELLEIPKNKKDKDDRIPV